MGPDDVLAKVMKSLGIEEADLDGLTTIGSRVDDMCDAYAEHILAPWLEDWEASQERTENREHGASQAK